jgi:hypothetical protein
LLAITTPPSGPYRVFAKQADAFAFAETCESDDGAVHVFAEETVPVPMERTEDSRVRFSFLSLFFSSFVSCSSGCFFFFVFV